MRRRRHALGGVPDLLPEVAPKTLIRGAFDIWCGKLPRVDEATPIVVQLPRVDSLGEPLGRLHPYRLTPATRLGEQAATIGDTS
jgi:hypothetical protein